MLRHCHFLNVPFHVCIIFSYLSNFHCNFLVFSASCLVYVASKFLFKKKISLQFCILQCFLLQCSFFYFSVVTRSCHTLSTPWTAECQASLSFTISWSLLKFMSIESLMLYNHLILCHMLLLLPSVFPASASFPKSQLFS